MKKIFLLTCTIIFIISCASKTVTVATKKNEVMPTVAVLETATILEVKPISGKELYENNCGKCHQFYAATDFSKTEWSSIIHRMQKKARLSDSEIETVYNFVTIDLK